MVHVSKVDVTDSIGEVFPLGDCLALCGWYGERDYSEPMAVMYPDEGTIVAVSDLDLTDSDGNVVDPQDLDWSLE